jgi:hypothetical protein
MICKYVSQGDTPVWQVCAIVSVGCVSLYVVCVVVRCTWGVLWKVGGSVCVVHVHGVCCVYMHQAYMCVLCEHSWSKNVMKRLRCPCVL